MGMSPGRPPWTGTASSQRANRARQRVLYLPAWVKVQGPGQGFGQRHGPHSSPPRRWAWAECGCGHLHRRLGAWWEGRADNDLGTPTQPPPRWDEGPTCCLPGRASSWLSTHPLSLARSLIYNIGLSLSLLSLYSILFLYSRRQNSIISFLSANGGGEGPDSLAPGSRESRGENVGAHRVGMR